MLAEVDSPGSTQMVEMFRDLLAYQWLIVGNDGHSKNYGLLLRGAARQLAPLYDTCSWMPYRLAGEKVEDLRTAMKIGSDYEISSADQPEAMLLTAERLRLPAAETAARIRDLADRLPAALEAAVEDLPAHQQNLPIVATYLAEQQERAAGCEQIAADAERIAGQPRRSP